MNCTKIAFFFRENLNDDSAQNELQIISFGVALSKYIFKLFADGELLSTIR